MTQDENNNEGVTVNPDVATSSPQNLLEKIREKIGWDNTLG